MIEYSNNLTNNIVEIRIFGKITEADLTSVIAQLKADLAQHGRLRVLEEVRNFEGIDPMALWKDAQFGFNHVGDFTHAAVVADTKWMQTAADAIGFILPSAVRTFEPSQIEVAREWLRNAPEPGQASRLEYRNNPDNNIVEITVEGTITAADVERLVAQMTADFQKHGKLRVLEEIRSLDGMEPMALWQDIRFALPVINDISHVAVVTDTPWIKTFSSLIGNVASAEVKGFELSQIDSARIWLVAQ